VVAARAWWRVVHRKPARARSTTDTTSRLGRSIDRRPASSTSTVSQLVLRSARFYCLSVVTCHSDLRVVHHGVKTTAVEVRAVSYEGSSTARTRPGSRLCWSLERGKEFTDQRPRSSASTRTSVEYSRPHTVDQCVLARRRGSSRRFAGLRVCESSWPHSW